MCLKQRWVSLAPECLCCTGVSATAQERWKGQIHLRLYLPAVETVNSSYKHTGNYEAAWKSFQIPMNKLCHVYMFTVQLLEHVTHVISEHTDLLSRTQFILKCRGCFCLDSACQSPALGKSAHLLLFLTPISPVNIFLCSGACAGFRFVAQGYYSYNKVLGKDKWPQIFWVIVNYSGHLHHLYVQ